MNSTTEHIKDLGDILKAELTSTESFKASMVSIISEVDSKIKNLKNIVELINGLKRSWKPYGGRAGKSEPFYCFLKKDTAKNESDWVFLRDLVEIKEGERLGDSIYGVLMVDDESQLTTDRCPKCQKESPIIYRYFQEYDSPGGDLWSIKHLLLCCNGIHTIKEDSHD